MSDDGTNKRDLSRGPELDSSPLWAGDGSALFFERIGGVNRNIWRMNPDGSEPSRITDVVALSGQRDAFINDHHPTAGVLFSVRSSIDALRTIWKMMPDGSEPAPINTPSWALIPPRWSSDGTRVAWSKLIFQVVPAEDELWVIDADGTNARMLSKTLAQSQGAEWDWDPIGPRLALATDVAGSFDIWLVPADGSTMTQITTGANAAEPVWSPDGSKIAYRDSNTNALFVISSDGTNQVDLAVTGTDMQWSSDGNRLAHCGDGGLAVIGADGQDGLFVDAGSCRSGFSYRR